MTSTKNYGIFRRMGHLLRQRYWVKQVQALERRGENPTREELVSPFIPPRKKWRWPFILECLYGNKLRHKFSESLDDSIGVYLGWDDIGRTRLAVTSEGRKIIRWTGLLQIIGKEFSVTWTLIAWIVTIILTAIGTYYAATKP